MEILGEFRQTVVCQVDRDEVGHVGGLGAGEALLLESRHAVTGQQDVADLRVALGQAGGVLFDPVAREGEGRDVDTLIGSVVGVFEAVDLVVCEVGA